MDEFDYQDWWFKKNNYMAEHLSESSLDAIATVMEKHRLAEEERKKPKPRKGRKKKR